jgi:putative transposase
MCRILGSITSVLLLSIKTKKDESELEEVVAEEFIRSRKAYGSRKIKKPYQNEAFRSADEKLVES